MMRSISSHPLSRATCGLFLATLLACSSDDPGSAPEPTTDVARDFGTTETWDIEADGRSGIVSIEPSSIDFALGEHRAVITIDANGLLDVRLRDAEGEVRYTGQRTSAKPFSIGVSSLSLGGLWSLAKTPTETGHTNAGDVLSLHVQATQIEAWCGGVDCAALGLEGNWLARAPGRDTAAAFGGLPSHWETSIEAKLDEETVRRSEAVLRIADRTITLEVDGHEELDLIWEGRTMSGTVGGHELAAVKR